VDEHHNRSVAAGGICSTLYNPFVIMWDSSNVDVGRAYRYETTYILKAVFRRWQNQRGVLTG
ncbi:MAG: hypothetical protein AAGE92_04125, partial [Cyanobacteria bacterium P01_G01_bin.4]